MDLPEGMEVVALAQPGDTVIFRMPPEATQKQTVEAQQLLAPMAEERDLKFLFVSGAIGVQNGGQNCKPPSKYFVIGNYLMVEVDGCNCAGGIEWPHEQYCGIEPVVPIAEIERVFKPGMTARYEEALRWLVESLDSDLFDSLEHDEEFGKDHFPQLARESEERVMGDDVEKD